MALRQVGVPDYICDRLSDDLTAWLQHILECKVHTFFSTHLFHIQLMIIMYR